MNVGFNRFNCAQDKGTFQKWQVEASCHVFSMINVLNVFYQLQHLLAKTMVWYFCALTFKILLFYELFCSVHTCFVHVFVLKFEHYAAGAVSPRVRESRCCKGARACADLSVFCWKGMTGVFNALCYSIAKFISESSEYSTACEYNSGRGFDDSRRCPEAVDCVIRASGCGVILFCMCVKLVQS